MRDEADVSERRGAGGAARVVSGVLAVLAVGLAAFSAWQAWERLAAERRLAALVEGGERIYAALEAWAAETGAPPPPGSSRSDGLNVRTLAPLSTRGYLAGAEEILAQLAGQRVTAYDVTGDRFWLVLRDASDPRLVVLVARTDRFPLVPETWLEGLYRVEGSRLVKIDLPPPAAGHGARQDAGHG
ncbi:MAG: hypothetical protein D6738_11740 [Acidobacteria bacterium]|nr:MAG: hypothetical protein D6738_11740 [Acidobacteriota bacterium]